MSDPVGAIVWSYDKDLWCTFSGRWHPNLGCAAANEILYVVHNNPTPTSSRLGSYSAGGTFGDDLGVASSYSMTIGTPWFKLGEFQRYQRVQLIHVIGARTSGSYSVGICYDYSDVVSETISGKTAFPFVWKPAKQKCSTIKLIITCSGEISISKIGFTVGLKRKPEYGA